MVTRSARKGAEFERVIVEYFRAEIGEHVCRPRAGERNDRGDLAGVPRWTFELKNYADVALGIRTGLADLEVEQANSATPFGAVIVKRRGITAPAEQLCVMRLGDVVPLIRLSAREI